MLFKFSFFLIICLVVLSITESEYGNLWLQFPGCLYLLSILSDFALYIFKLFRYIYIYYLLSHPHFFTLFSSNILILQSIFSDTNIATHFYYDYCLSGKSISIFYFETLYLWIYVCVFQKAYTQILFLCLVWQYFSLLRYLDHPHLM